MTDAATSIPRRSEFPENFVFGAATAAYQIEGHSFGGAGACHWDSFAATGNNVIRNEDGAVACDHYHRWPEDLDLVADAGLDAYRFSTSWARVMPDGKTVNAEGLDFYDRLVDGVVERGLLPFLTLYHWDLPSALADVGGWRNRDIAERFADFSEIVMERIGDRVARTATINEPWCVSWLSHFVGHHAPGLRDIRAAARSMHHIQLAHGLALERLRGLGRKELGTVLNFTDIAPQSDRDTEAAARQDAINNLWFMQSIANGSYPEAALEGLAPHLPDGWEDDMALISAPIDWLGINYYTRTIIAEEPGAPWPATTDPAGPLPKTQMGWEIYPEGLSNLLTRMARDFVDDLPIYVTENGMAWDDHVVAGQVDDSVRTDYIARHLGAVRTAMEKGANVKGFFYWSLLDNYEWAFGYEKRFGLVHVDFDSQTRTPKASWHALKAALAG